MYLYIDSTEKLIIGLLDDSFRWIKYNEEGIKSASSKIQGVIYNLLDEQKLKITDINAIFQASGPGSYTGMRVSEGLCQILDWHDLNIFSFYHFEVPRIYGNKEGNWLANAYKGDLFIYQWNESEDTYHLTKIDEAKIHKSDNSFSHFLKDPFEDIDSDKLTSELIKNNPEILFSHLKSNQIRREPYYYRPLEVEFTKPRM